MISSDLLDGFEINPELQRVYQAAAKELRRYSGVVGVGVGRPRTNGLLDGREDVIRVFVGKKLATRSLSDRDRLPQTFRGVRVDVEELGERKKQSGGSPGSATALQVFRPGTSISCEGGPAGTAGLLVRDENGNASVLSAYHVLVPDNASSTTIFHPAQIDGNALALGSQHKSDKTQGVAIALVQAGWQLDPRQVQTDALVTTLRLPRRNEKVVKVGRSTGVTRGVVRDLVSVDQCSRGILIWPHNGPNASYEISLGGDSGAMWYAESDGAGIGIHCFGDDDTNTSSEFALAASAVHAASALKLKRF